MKKIDPSIITATVSHLQRLATENGGRCPTDVVRAVAATYGCTERTVWNWLRHGTPQPTSPRSLTRKQKVEIAKRHGNLKATWQQLHRSGSYLCSYRQFIRDFRTLPPIQQVGLTKGIPDALQQGLYLKVATTGRTDRVIFDHTMADVRLQRVRNGNYEMFRPWLSLLIDTHSRVILSCIVTEGDGMKGDPNTEALIALMGGAIHGTWATDGTFVGGMPRLVQSDNAKAHLAEAMVNGYLHLQIPTIAIDPGSPWQDGKVERLMRTVKEEFLADLPGFTAVLPDRYARDPWTPSDCLTMDNFMVLLREWIDFYNYERVHSSLGTTPFEAWKNDTTPIEQVPDDLIRSSFMAEKRSRIMSKNGVRFDHVDYTDPLLKDLVGKEVHIRYLPNDKSFIDVYLDGHFVCTAYSHASLTKEKRNQIAGDRMKQIGYVDRVIKQSRKRQEQNEFDGTPLVRPERDPNKTPASHSDGDDEFLDYLERLQSEEGEEPADDDV